MIIKLNVFQNGSCSRIYAYAEDHEDEYLLKAHYFLETKIPTRAVRIWHNKDTVMPQMIVPEPLENCDNDYCVTFKSKVPFKEFCEKFAQSEYNNASKYDVLYHNCSHAANYALKLAGIDLGIRDGAYRLTRVLSPDSMLRLPTKALSPSDVYCLAKEYKIKMLQNQEQPAQDMYFKMELAASALHFWAYHTHDDRLKNNVKMMTSAIKQNMRTRAHHAELYLKAMVDAIDLLVCLGSHAQHEDYQHFAGTFKEREQSSVMKVYNRNSSWWYIGGFVAVDAFMYSVGAYNDWRIKVGVAMLSSAVAINDLIKLMHAMRNESYDHVPTQKNDTLLSTAMTEFSAEIAANNRYFR